MKKRKSQVAISTLLILLGALFGCKPYNGTTNVANAYSPPPTNERPHPPQNSASASKTATALSSSDFVIIRKSDGARIDILSTKGFDIEKTLGPTAKTVRLDALDFEKEKKKQNTWTVYVVTMRKYYQSLFFSYDENVNSGNIKEIRIDGPEYETARGLSVGDPIEQLYEKYLITNRINLLFDNPDDRPWNPDDKVAPRHFKYQKYYKLELGSPPHQFYDKNAEGDTMFLGMNFFVDAAGRIVHIDYYHEGTY
jgi:hypothetical protein